MYVCVCVVCLPSLPPSQLPVMFDDDEGEKDDGAKPSRKPRTNLLAAAVASQVNKKKRNEGGGGLFGDDNADDEDDKEEDDKFGSSPASKPGPKPKKVWDQGERGGGGGREIGCMSTET